VIGITVKRIIMTAGPYVKSKNALFHHYFKSRE